MSSNTNKKRQAKRPVKKKNRSDKDKKQLSGLAQWSLAMLCSILIIGIVGFIAGQHTLASGGKETSDDLILSFFHALEDKDSKALKKCLLTIEPNFDNIYGALDTYIQSEEGIVSIDYDGIVVETTDPMANETLEEEMRMNGVSETAFSYIQVPMTRTVDGATYHVTTAYYMTAYKLTEKWYIYDVMKDITFVLSGTDANGEIIEDPSIAYRLFNVMMIGGDDDIGFIPLDNTWYAMENAETEQEEPIEGAVKDLGYVQESGNAIIHMVLLESDKTPHELADQLYANLTADADAAIEVNVAETEIGGRTTWHVGFYSQDIDAFFFSYIIDTRDYDGMLRYLTLESNSDYRAATLYLTNFLTPDEHYTMYREIEETEE